MVELGTHNLCPLTNEVGECILGIAFLRVGLCEPSYRERWLWESSDCPLCTSLQCYTSPASCFWYGWQHRRYFSRRSRPAERARQAHGVATAFSVSRNSFVRFSSILITPGSFTLILANTTNRVGFS